MHPELEKNVECEVIEKSKEGNNYRCPKCKTEIFLKRKNKENLVANAQQVRTAIKPNTSSNALNSALNS